MTRWWFNGSIDTLHHDLRYFAFTLHLRYFLVIWASSCYPLLQAAVD